MTPRSLFNIVLKIMGIFFLKEILFMVPQLFGSVFGLVNGSSLDEAIWVLLYTLAMIVIYWFIGYFLIFKTEKIIDELKLDKGFDQEIIPLNLHRSSLLSIALIVMGGFMIVYSLPALIKDIYEYFAKKRFYYDTNPDVFNMILSGSRVICGIILIVAQRPIVNAIELKRKNGEIKNRKQEAGKSTEI